MASKQIRNRDLEVVEERARKVAFKEEEPESVLSQEEPRQIEKEVSISRFDGFFRLSD